MDHNSDSLIGELQDFLQSTSTSSLTSATSATYTNVTTSINNHSPDLGFSEYNNGQSSYPVVTSTMSATTRAALGDHLRTQMGGEKRKLDSDECSSLPKSQRLSFSEDLSHILQNSPAAPGLGGGGLPPPAYDTPVSSASQGILAQALTDKKGMRPSYDSTNGRPMAPMNKPNMMGGIAHSPEDLKAMQKIKEMIKNPNLDQQTRNAELHRLIRDHPNIKQVFARIKNQQQMNGMTTNGHDNSAFNLDQQQQQHVNNMMQPQSENSWDPFGAPDNSMRRNVNVSMASPNGMYSNMDMSWSQNDNNMMSPRGFSPAPNVTMRPNTMGYGGMHTNNYMMNVNEFNGPMRGPSPNNFRMNGGNYGNVEFMNGYNNNNNSGMDMNGFGERGGLRHPSMVNRVPFSQMSPHQHQHFNSNPTFSEGNMSRMNGGMTTATSTAANFGIRNNVYTNDGTNFNHPQPQPQQPPPPYGEYENFNNGNMVMEASRPVVMWQRSQSAISNRLEFKRKLREEVSKMGMPQLLSEAFKVEEDLFHSCDSFEAYSMKLVRWLAGIYDRKPSSSSAEVSNVDSSTSVDTNGTEMVADKDTKENLEDLADTQLESPSSAQQSSTAPGSKASVLAEQNPILSQLLPAVSGANSMSQASTVDSKISSPNAPSPPSGSKGGQQQSSSTDNGFQSPSSMPPKSPLGNPVVQRGARRASGKGQGQSQGQSQVNNPYSVDSGFGSPRSNTSTSISSPKIQQGTSPLVAQSGSSSEQSSPEK